MESSECSESDANITTVPVPEVPPPEYSSILAAAPEYTNPLTMPPSYDDHALDNTSISISVPNPFAPPPSYSSLFVEALTAGNGTNPVINVSVRNRELDAGDLMQMADLQVSPGLDRGRASDRTDDHSASTVSVRKNLCRYADILFLVILSLLNVLALVVHIVLRYRASRLENDGQKDAARRFRIASYLVGFAGILASIGVICWGTISDRCELIGYAVNGNCFKTVRQYGKCSTVSCCATDSILYQHSCYADPDASLSPTCRYIVYWTCYSDRRYYGSCASGRCCRPYETYYVNYCNYNSTSAVASRTTESSAIFDRCRYSINGTCHANAYFSYSVNGCPLTATYDSSTKNCYFD